MFNIKNVLVLLVLINFVVSSAIAANTPPPGPNGTVMINNNGQWGATDTSAKAQSALNSLYTYPSMASPIGTSSPIIPKVVGAGDEGPVTAAVSTSQNFKTNIFMGNGAQFNNQVKFPFVGFYVSIGGNAGDPQDTNSLGTVAPRLLANTANIAANAPGMTLFDINGARSFHMQNSNLVGTSGSPFASAISNSTQNNGCCAVNAISLLNQSVTNFNSGIGPPVDLNYNPILAGGVLTGTVAGGSSYTTSGTFYIGASLTGVPLTGGSGTGATGAVAITGGAMVQLLIMSGGQNYVVGDVLGIGSCCGPGSGATFTVTSIGRATYSAANILYRGTKVVFANNLGVDLGGNLSDLMDYNSEHTGGGIAIKPTFNGGNNAVANVRIEDKDKGIYFGSGANPIAPMLVGNVTFTTNNNFGLDAGFDMKLGQGTAGYALSNITSENTRGTRSSWYFGGDGDLKGVVGSSLLWNEGSNTPYCIDISSTHVVDNIALLMRCNNTGSGDINFGQVPNHLFVVDISSSWPKFLMNGLPIGIGTTVPVGTSNAALDIETTTSIILPVGTTGQRPASPQIGMVRYNSTLGSYEGYNGAWGSLVNGTTNIGIGTSVPLNNLDIYGNAVIGTSYAGVNTAPINGFLVQGNVGIGTASPVTGLDVNGDITMETGTAGALVCLTATHALGHCTAAASCTGTCTCTCTAN